MAGWRSPDSWISGNVKLLFGSSPQLPPFSFAFFFFSFLFFNLNHQDFRRAESYPVHRHYFFKEIQCGQSICVNFSVDFYEGLGSNFSFVLYFPCLLSFTHLSVLLIASHFPEKTCYPRKKFGVSPGTGHEDVRKGHLPVLCGTAGLLEELVLAAPWASDSIRGTESPGRRPGRIPEGQNASLVLFELLAAQATAGLTVMGIGPLFCPVCVPGGGGRE